MVVVSKIRANLSLVIAAVLSALLVVGVLTFAGPCVHEDGSHGGCFTASQAIVTCAAISLVASIVGIALGKARARGALALVAALAGACAAACPGWLFSLCMVQTMRCWTIMRPFALVLGILVAVCGVVAAVKAFSAKASRTS